MQIDQVALKKPLNDANPLKITDAAWEALPILEPCNIQFSNRTLPAAVETALTQASIHKHRQRYALEIPSLDFDDYQIFKTLLASLRGEWSGKVHLFDYNPQVVISEILAAKRVPKTNPYALFVTPEEIIEHLFEFLNLPSEKESDCSILEPSAGTGAIATRLRKRLPNARIDVAEIDPFNQRMLNGQGFKLIAYNWLKDPRPTACYDYCVMNPPFQNGQFVDHILLALKALKKGGKLAAIVPISMLQQATHKMRNFRNLVAEYGTWEYLGSVFPNVSVECLAILIHNIDDWSLAHLWQPQRLGYQSMWHEDIEIALEQSREWGEFLDTVDPSSRSTERTVSCKLDQFVNRLIKDEYCCFLYDDRVKQQLLQSALDQITHRFY